MAAGIAVGARVIVVENVPAVKRSRQNVVDRALALLTAADYRVDDNGLTLTASDFGTPQERRRHFVIASRSERIVQTSDFLSLRVPAPTVAEALEGLANAGRRTVFDEPSQLSDENLKRVQFLVEREEYDLPDVERPDCHRLKRHNYISVYGRLRPDKVAPTITTGFLSPGRGRFTHPFEARIPDAARGSAAAGIRCGLRLDGALERFVPMQLREHDRVGGAATTRFRGRHGRPVDPVTSGHRRRSHT